MLLKALPLLALIVVTVLLAQPTEKRIITFKLVIKEGEAKSFALLIFRQSDKKLILIVRVFEGNTISISLDRKHDYIVGAYSRIGKLIYAGYKRITKETNEVIITLKPLPNLIRRPTRLMFISRKTLPIMSVELLVPFVGVIERVKVNNQTIYVPCIPLVIVRKENSLTYYGVFLPGDKEIKLVSTKEVKGETFIIATSKKSVEGLQRFSKLSISTINFLKIMIIVTLSLLIAYISYITAKRHIKRRV